MMVMERQRSAAIKEVGGITIAQKPDNSRQPDMPESAIASGCIDFVLAPEKNRSGNCTNCAHGIKD